MENMNKSQNGYYAFWLCLFCIIVFIIQSIFPGFTDVFVLNGQSFPEVWRFITSIFLHGSIPHLLYNLFALALFGIILEGIIGSRKLIFVFLSTGILANLVSVNFYSSSLGASGAIYGILGCLTLLRPKMMVWVYGFPMPMFLAAIVWVLGSVIGVFIPSDIGHIAHLSGIIFGLVIGFVIRKNFKQEKVIQQKVRIPEGHLRDWEDRYLRS